MESICGTRILLSLPRCPTLYTPTHLFLSASASPFPPSGWLVVAEVTFISRGDEMTLKEMTPEIASVKYL